MPPNCPPRNDLSAFLVGQVSGEQIDALAEHVDGCEACRTSLAALDDTADPLLTDLRSPPPAEIALTTTVHAPLHIRDCQIIGLIGEGGMGTVYAAHHTRLNRKVAIKVLPGHRCRDPNAIERFQREMGHIGAIDHPHIVRAMDAGDEGDTHFLVMEFVDGLDLGKVVHRLGPLSIADACEIARQAALALAEIQKRELVHRDIKPSNLMLSTTGTVKVLDLGLARLQTETSAGAEMSASGQLMGTVEYMAPEQARDPRTADIRADLYGLGCTLFKLLVGHPPFRHADYPNPVAMMMAHAMVLPPGLRVLRPDVPVRLARIVARMIAKQPTDRFANPLELAAALARFTRGHDLVSLIRRAVAAEYTVETSPPLGTASEPAGVSPRAQPRRSRWPIAAAASVLLLVTAGLVANHFLSDPPLDQDSDETADPNAEKSRETPAASASSPPAPRAASREKPVQPPRPLRIGSPVLPAVHVASPAVPIDEIRNATRNKLEVDLPPDGRLAFVNRIREGQNIKEFWIRTAKPDPIAIMVFSMTEGFRPYLTVAWRTVAGRIEGDGDIASGRGQDPFIFAPVRPSPDNWARLQIHGYHAYVLAERTTGDFTVVVWQQPDIRDLDPGRIGIESSPVLLNQDGRGGVRLQDKEKPPVINYPGDIDVFQLRPKAPARLALSARVKSGDLDPYVRMFDGSGKLLAAAPEGGPQGESSIAFTAEANQTYYFAVTSYDGKATGQYRVRIEPAGARALSDEK